MFDLQTALVSDPAQDGMSQVLSIAERAGRDDCATLGELNARRVGVMTLLADARARGDREAGARAAAELVRIDDAVGAAVVALALRNADIARLRLATA